MNYLTLKLKYCQEIIKQALYLAINEYSLTDDELKAKLSDSIRLAINQTSNSVYDFIIEAIKPFYVMINEQSVARYNVNGKVAKSIKFNVTDTSSFTEYIANLKVDVTHYIEILQESYIEHITRLIRADSIKTIINDDAETFEQVLLLIKEPVKFNITELSSSSVSLNMVMIDKSIPFVIITESSSDGIVNFKFSTPKKVKITRNSKTQYYIKTALGQYILLKEYDNLSWKTIDELKLTESYTKEI